MPVGGARPGAGRKAGGKNRATVEREARAAQGIADARTTGVLPLDIVLAVMRGDRSKQVTDRQYQAAVDALPYVHARLSSATLTHRDALDDLTADELRSLLAAAERRSDFIGDADQGEVGAAPAGKPH